MISSIINKQYLKKRRGRRREEIRVRSRKQTALISEALWKHLEKLHLIVICPAQNQNTDVLRRDHFKYQEYVLLKTEIRRGSEERWEGRTSSRVKKRESILLE